MLSLAAIPAPAGGSARAGALQRPPGADILRALGAALALAASLLLALATRRRSLRSDDVGRELDGHQEKDSGARRRLNVNTAAEARHNARAASSEPSPSLPELEDMAPLSVPARQVMEARPARVARCERLAQSLRHACPRGGQSNDQLLPGAQRVYVKSFGCAHNSSDSEVMMGLLEEYGYELVNGLEDADVCLVNSCTVKNPSQDSAVNLVRLAQNNGKRVVLTGCVPSADASIAATFADVSLLSVAQVDRVVEVVEETLKGHTVHLLGKRRALPALDLPKVRRNSCVEIIPISGGCLGNCSYCKTKHARGRLSSYSEGSIVTRAVQAAREGASEVWLASEDTGAYGLDIGTNIASLLPQVADALPPGVMLKLGMTNPPFMLAHVDAVAEVLRRPNVFAFIHVPVQSGSDKVLQAMVREYTVDDFRRLVDGLRARVPEVLVATDVISGFPAEGEEDHLATLDLVRAYRFPVLNISQFYPRPGTAAARMKRLPGAVVKRRSTEVTQLFESYETHGALVGREERTWFSDTDTRRGQTVGHTKGYVKVIVPRDDGLLARSALVRVRRATKWHLEGEVLGGLQ